MKRWIALVVICVVVVVVLLAGTIFIGGTHVTNLSKVGGGPIPSELLENCPPRACGGTDMPVGE